MERASINSFGVGGSNAHVIIDSAASYHLKNVRQMRIAAKAHLLLFSAKSQKALTQIASNYQQFVQNNPNSIVDLAYTLAHRREHLTHRSFAVVEGKAMGAPSLIRKIGEPLRVVMVFTGQGAQWPQMGLELLDSNQVFLNSIQALDDYLPNLPSGAPEWSIEAELRKPAKQSQVDDPILSQPLCTAIQIAFVDVLSSFGIQPDAVVGHSSGEIAAAYAAGSLTAKEAITVAAFRGIVAKAQAKPGAMIAVGMGCEDAEKYLIPGVNIACDNSPQQVTISGDLEAIQRVTDDILRLQPGIAVKKLQVNKAYHS